MSEDIEHQKITEDIKEDESDIPTGIAAVSSSEEHPQPVNRGKVIITTINITREILSGIMHINFIIIFQLMEEYKISFPLFLKIFFAKLSGLDVKSFGVLMLAIILVSMYPGITVITDTFASYILALNPDKKVAKPDFAEPYT